MLCLHDVIVFAKCCSLALRTEANSTFYVLWMLVSWLFHLSVKLNY